MEFTLKLASDWWNDKKSEKISVDKIEDLEQYTTYTDDGICGFSQPHELIINFRERTITIYDTYIE